MTDDEKMESLRDLEQRVRGNPLTLWSETDLHAALRALEDLQQGGMPVLAWALRDELESALDAELDRRFRSLP